MTLVGANETSFEQAREEEEIKKKKHQSIREKRHPKEIRMTKLQKQTNTDKSCREKIQLKYNR